MAISAAFVRTIECRLASMRVRRNKRRDAVLAVGYAHADVIAHLEVLGRDLLIRPAIDKKSWPFLIQTTRLDTKVCPGVWTDGEYGP
jgi:inactivated superfamily I helicase